ncbi:unnamed protein product [Medioppia subpectinata]|uniref:Cytochrome P450 n=1 Tax=Medioppia subpectinata TaxID=1979941 RepID=A0A7R9L636_9ACAR|nr:unnamed protein product [Medioppia subpectinata]CAG2115078.1 unnamed protein product [Medioppia subpectinata]
MHLFYYSKWYRILNYWSDRNISGPKPIPYFGNTLRPILKGKECVDMEWYKTFGQFYGVYELAKPCLRVSDPVLIKQILVKDFYKFRNRKKNSVADKIAVFKNTLNRARDGHWKRIRALISPTFTSGKLKHMYPLINECCRDFLAALDRDVSTGRTEVDVKQLMGAYTMDVIASTTFSTKINPYSNPNNPFTSKSKAVFTERPVLTFLSLILPKFIINNNLWKIMVKDPEVATRFFIDFSMNLISERKKSDNKHNDFLQLLIDAEKEDNNTTTTTGADSVASDALEGHYVNDGVDQLMAEKQALSGVEEKKLTTDEILGQCFLFCAVGYETTASTLSYCLYELALNPDIQDLLVAETKEAFNENTADIDYETLCRLPLLDAVISETLRKYPPTLRLEREAMEDVMLTRDTDGSMFKIETGVPLEISVYAIHHDPDHYPDPEAFKPDRFLPQYCHHIKPYTYLPFGDGPRNCIAMRFALLIAKLVLAKMIQQFRLSRVPDTDVPIIFNSGPTLLHPTRLVLGVEKS